MLAAITHGDVCDTSLSYSQRKANIPYLKRTVSGNVTCTVLQPLASSCSISSSNTLPIPITKIQSLLLETPSYRALMDSGSIASFPERRLEGEEDSYETHLDYLLMRSAQLLKHRQDEDLFQPQMPLAPCSVVLPPHCDESSGSDSSSQAEFGSQGSFSQESDPELQTVLTTYYAPPRTVASLVTLPSLPQAAMPGTPLSVHESCPTIPSESSRSLSLRSLESIEEAHKMISQLEAIAAQLQAVDDSSLPCLSRLQSSTSSLVALSAKPDIPLPPLPPLPSPLSDRKLFPSPCSVNTLLPGPSRASSLSGSSMAHSLAYLRTGESTASGLEQEQAFLGEQEKPDSSIPQIVVTGPSSDTLPGGGVDVKDATLLMDVVDACYGDYWSLDRARTPAVPEVDSILPVPSRRHPSPPLSPPARQRVTFSIPPPRESMNKKWYHRLTLNSGPGRRTEIRHSPSRRPSPPAQPKSWFRRLFLTSHSQPRRKPPSYSHSKNIRAKQISYPTPILYRKSWPACAVDPRRVRKSMGEPSRRRLRVTQQEVAVQRKRPKTKSSGWDRIKAIFMI